MENNQKLRQKSKEEIECLSEVNKLKEDEGDMDVSSLISERMANRKKSESLLVEVILFCFIIMNKNLS